jgi:hypothetical protein
MINTIVIAIIVVLIFIMLWPQEDFSTRREKASAIQEWFNQRSDHRYNDYKKAVPDSDIVEYDKVLALYNGGSNTTVEDIVNQL